MSKPAKGALVLKLGTVICFFVLAVSVSVQGWRERTLVRAESEDLVTSILSAGDLLHHGTLPYRGAVASTLLFTSPGTAWLLAPGMLIFQDPRLFELPLSILLFAFTLAGIVLVGNRFGDTCGWLAACIYASSWTGMFFASSLWPRGHPCFVIWVFYCCLRAVETGKRYWILLAICIYLAGMYIFIEIAPAGIMIVGALVLNRTLITWRWIPVAALTALILWGPYLHYESNTHFADFRKAILRTSAIPNPNGCTGPVTARKVESQDLVDFATLDLTYPPVPRFSSALRKVAAYRIPVIIKSLFWNTAYPASEGRWSPAIRSGGLFMLLLLGAALLYAAIGRRGDSWTARGLVILIPAILVLAAVVALGLKAVEIVLAAVSWNGFDRQLWDLRHQIFACVAWGALFWAGMWAVDAERFKSTMLALRNDRARTAGILLLAAFLAGQATWSLVAGTESRRFWWLWPLQSLLIAFGACVLADSIRWRQLRLAILALPLVLSLATPLVRTRINDWRRTSWGGDEDALIQMMDDVAQDAQTQGDAGGNKTVSVSYDTFVTAFIPAANSVDPRYRPGMGYDLYLKYKYGLEQEVTCADSFNPKSRYLIREDRKDAGPDKIEFVHPQQDLAAYMQIAQAGKFSLWRRLQN
jgi:hypothetical protein